MGIGSLCIYGFLVNSVVVSGFSKKLFTLTNMEIVVSREFILCLCGVLHISGAYIGLPESKQVMHSSGSLKQLSGVCPQEL